MGTLRKNGSLATRATGLRSGSRFQRIVSSSRKKYVVLLKIGLTHEPFSIRKVPAENTSFSRSKAPAENTSFYFFPQPAGV
jgi:hypothetical protein